MATEYTEAFARYIIECKKSYEDVLARIESGNVPAGLPLTVTSTPPALPARTTAVLP